MTWIEVCVELPSAARAARRGGARAIELCADLERGGTTPSHGAVEHARRTRDLELNVLVRPRAGDFHYGEDERAVMRADVVAARTLGADGVALGCLRPDATIDREATRELVELARPLRVTFHRAFDLCPDRREALEELVALGIERVLSSGGGATALAGSALLAELVELSAGRIAVIAAGGVRPGNVRSIVDATRVPGVHFAARATSLAGPAGFGTPCDTDEELVRACVRALA